MSDETRRHGRMDSMRILIGGSILAAGVSIGAIIGTVANSGPEESCLEALDAAEEVITLSGEGLMHAGEAFGAVERMDLLALDESVAEMESLVEPTTEAAEQYTEVEEECRNV